MSKMLSPDQQHAVDRIKGWFYGSSAPCFALGGLAGTGKSTIAAVLAEEFKRHGSRVVFSAPFGKAASVLRSKGLPAHTLHSLLYRVAGTYVDEKGKEQPSFVDKPWSEFCDLLVVDEASTVNQRLFRDVMQRDIRVLWLGDHGQLKPVGGDPKIMERAAVRLEKIHRQAADSEILQAAYAVRNGLKYGKPKTDDLRVGKVRDLYHAVTVAKRTGVDQVIVATNKERHEFNRLYRERDGLGRQAPQVGERITCLLNNRDEDIWNGQTFIVASVKGITEDSVRLDLTCTDDGTLRRDVSVFRHGLIDPHFESPEYLRNGTNLFAFGYAMTCHKMQGSQAGHVMVVDRPIAEPERWRYTAYTRAERILTVALYL